MMPIEPFSCSEQVLDNALALWLIEILMLVAWGNILLQHGIALKQVIIAVVMKLILATKHFGFISIIKAPQEPHLTLKLAIEGVLMGKAQALVMIDLNIILKVRCV
jgi:hypothetical protein